MVLLDSDGTPGGAHTLGMGGDPELALETRVLDIGAPDSCLGNEFSARGVTRYLGLVEPARYEAMVSSADSMGDRLQPLHDPMVVARSSADLLVLRRGYERLVWGWPQLAQFKHVAIEADPSGPETRLAIRIASMRGRMRAVGKLDMGRAGKFSLFELNQPREVRPRTYFSPFWGVGGLASRLEEAGLDYAVLRWFETLPKMDPGEDLDILVRDAHVERFRRVVESEPGTIPIDLYSVSGLSGTDFRGAAYYVPGLAARILGDAIVHPSGMRVPCAQDYLYSLVYHALYHKGASSGLPSRLMVDGDATPEHNYREAIARIARQCGADIPEDMERLDEWLQDVGWRPPLDALRRLAVDNEWLRNRIGSDRVRTGTTPELAVFLVRERAVEYLRMDSITSRLESLGFEILSIHELDEDARRRAAESIRGGNWGKGPYPVSAGRPAWAIVCIHFAPQPVDQSLRDRYPHLSNADTLNAKLEVRALVEDVLGPGAAFNAMHSADDDPEAWEYLRVVVPGAVERIRTEFDARIGRRVAPEGTDRTLSSGRRARVDVVRRHGVPVVRKTYTVGGRRHFHREIVALDALSAQLPTIPSVLDRGDDWFEISYFDDLLPRYRGGLIPLRVVRQMIAVLRDIHEAGFDLVDAKPDNFVWSPRGGLHAVDLEFAYPARKPRRSFIEGPVFQSPDPSLYEDLPVGDSSFDVRWLPRTGMSGHVLVNARPIVQHAHRALYRLRRLTVAPGSPPRAMVRKGKTRIRQASTGLREAVFAWAVASSPARKRRTS